ncbi:MAG: hypothetical protein LBD63_01195 [Mycoplasmataceae bacterium]|jgi:translation elongation factor P/translation initiation factor 5A|nr:hypothetical protein [Mycoplasmataceae bacterium]
MKKGYTPNKKTMQVIYDMENNIGVLHAETFEEILQRAGIFNVPLNNKNEKVGL